MMNKTRLHLALCIELLAPSTTVYAGLASTYIEGDDVYYMHQSAETYHADAERYETFWRCSESLYNCAGQYNSEVVARSGYSGSLHLDDPGSVYGAEVNLGFVGMVSANIQAYPAQSPHQGRGAVLFDFLSTRDSLTLDPYGGAFPNDRALGYRVQNIIPEFVLRGDDGVRSYKISSSLDASMVPVGYSAYLSSRIFASIYDTFTDSEGMPTIVRQTILDETYEGDFLRDLSISRNLDDFFPGSQREYAYYSLMVETRFAFVPTYLVSGTTAVPEPGTLLLCLFGVAGLAMGFRNAK